MADVETEPKAPPSAKKADATPVEETAEAPATHEFWRWVPDAAEVPDGVYQVVPFGEVVPGRIVAVPRGSAAAATVRSHPFFKKATQSAYESQHNIYDDRQARRITTEEK